MPDFIHLYKNIYGGGWRFYNASGQPIDSVARTFSDAVDWLRKNDYVQTNGFPGHNFWIKKVITPTKEV